MSIINYIEHLAGKDKLEIEFSVYDYFKSSYFEDTADVDKDIYIELHQLMYCYYFEATRPIFQPMNRAVCFDFRGRNMIEKIIMEDNRIKITFTKDSLKFRNDKEWITQIIEGNQQYAPIGQIFFSEKFNIWGKKL